MQAIQLTTDWNPRHLHFIDLPDPGPGPGEALVAIRAISINPRDLVMCHGGYGRQGGKLPIIPLCDGAGEVIALGEGVTRVAVGDRVSPTFSRTWLNGEIPADYWRGAHGGPLDGTACQLMSIPAETLVKLPDYLSFDQAATLPCAAVTAWNAVVAQGQLRAGQRILIQGTGGVALFALQFALMQGAEVIVISSSDAKLDTVRQLGAQHGINYREHPSWGKLARDISAGEGVDHVLELGGADTLEQSLLAIRPGGSLSLIGVLGGGLAQLPLGRVVTRNVRLQGVTVGSRALFEDMLQAMALHGTVPVIDPQGFSLETLPEALERLPRGEHLGKIVGTVPSL